MNNDAMTFATVAFAVFVALFIGNAANTAFTEMNAARLEAGE